MDLNAALARLEGDMDLLQEISGLFLDTYHDLLAGVKNAVDTNSSEDLVAAAHSLKGTVGNFAAKSAHEAALALEMMGRQNKMERATEAYSRLEREVGYLAEDLARLCMEEAA